MKKLILTCALLFLPVMAYSQAACTTATCNAASANESDVLAALPSNANANATVVVNIPTDTKTWTTGFNYTIPTGVTSLTIQGNSNVSCTGTAGTSSYACTANDNTVFIDSYSSSNQPLMSIHVGTASFRMTGITFQGGTLTGGVTKPNGFLNFDGTSTSFRIDHSHFNTLTYSPANSGAGMTIFTNLWGVVDHSVADMSGQNNFVRDYAGSGDFGDANWAQPTNFGTSSFMFVENDVINGGAANDCDFGGRVVLRYSTINAASSGGDQGLWQTHQMGQGTPVDRTRGCRALEVYHLYVFNPNPSNALFTAGDGGSGTGLIWNNSVSTGYNNDVGFQNIRELATGHSQTAPPNGIGYCGTGSNGVSSAWDGNTNSQGYPCIDQTGRGQGDLLNGQNFPNMGASGCTPGVNCNAFWPHNKSEPWYMWNETIAAGKPLCIFPVWNGVQIVQNQDVFCPAASFNGTVGTGFGLLSARPTACTAGPGGTFNTSPGGASYGVGYFATDANSGNGELYVCTTTGSPGTWTGIYQPFTYPHPLVSSQTSPPTAAPGAGTYSSAQSVTLSDSTPSSTITFCADGTNTCTPSTTFTSPITISTTSYIRAFANASGFTQSPTVSFLYTIGLGAPTLSAGTGNYLTLPNVTVTLPAGATGCYTLNGSTPTATSGTCGGGSTTYSSPVTIPSSGTTLKVIASKSGVANSTETDATYTVVPIILNSNGLFANPGTFSTGTVTLNPTAGDGITCELVFANGATSGTIADNRNAGNYLAAIPSHPNLGAFVGIFYKSNVAAGSTVITFTLNTTGGSIAMACQDWRALAGTFTLDSPFTQQQDGSGSTLTTGSAKTPSVNNEVVIGNAITNNLAPITAGANFTAVGFAPNGPNQFPQYWLQTTATSTNSPYPLAASDTWTDQMTAFGFTSGIVPPPQPFVVVIGP